MDSSELAALIDVFPGRTVAVIGDVVADEFVYGRVARVSREAPVLILEYDSTEIVPGAGGNAANNVAALGGRASLVSVIGLTELARTGQEHASRYAAPLTIWPLVAVLYLALTFPLTRMAEYLEHRWRPVTRA